MNIYLEKKNPAENMYRFYSITVTPTLFGDWALVRGWGRIGSRGSKMEEWFETKLDAIELAIKINSQKKRRGYQTNPYSASKA